MEVMKAAVFEREGSFVLKDGPDYSSGPLGLLFEILMGHLDRRNARQRLANLFHYTGIDLCPRRQTFWTCR